MRTGRFSRRYLLRVLAVLLLPAVSFFLWVKATDNFGTVDPGRVFRSWQMSDRHLAGAIRERRVKTVLNLRGVNPSRAWYRAERAATTGAGATQVDVTMASDQWMSRAQIRAVVRVLDTCDYPLLIHCEWGAERTGLVSAFAALLRPGGTLDEAKAQFSVRHLYVPAGDGKVMGEHLDLYEVWLRGHGWGHSPERFRLWVADEYRPLTPSREQWPYDPYPLLVVTRPDPTGSVRPVAAVEAGREQRR